MVGRGRPRGRRDRRVPAARPVPAVVVDRLSVLHGAVVRLPRAADAAAHDAAASGAWSRAASSRPAAGCCRSCALLFIPVAVFAPKLYLWARPEAVAADEILKFKAPYLNMTVLRSMRAVGLLRLLEVLRDAAEQVVGGAGSRRGGRHRGRHAALPRRQRAGPVFFILLMSLAAVDWIMSLDPHW